MKELAERLEEALANGSGPVLILKGNTTLSYIPDVVLEVGCGPVRPA